MLASNDYGRDEDSVQTLMKKLEGIERELNTFQHTLERLAKLSRDLVNRSHFDSENILRKQVKLIIIKRIIFISYLINKNVLDRYRRSLYRVMCIK